MSRFVGAKLTRETSSGIPPAAGIVRSFFPNHGPLIYRRREPSGDQDGKFPFSAIRRALPPSAGITQMSPPMRGLSVPYGRIGAVPEREETNAICLPSGENAG